MSRRSRVEVEETSDWISVGLGGVDVIGLRVVRCGSEAARPNMV